ncbi:MAG: SprT family zinc-dependent metalloprotease [Betaproteobacteria bacterium]
MGKSTRPAVAYLRLDDLLGGRGKRDGSRRDEGHARRIALAGHPVDYRLVRARRHSIGMQIDLSGLTVRAPRWVTIREIEEALGERAEWVVRTLEEWRGRRRDVLPREWKNGAPILFAGRELALAVYPSRTKAIMADLFHFTILHPSPQDERQIAAFVARWLKDEALLLVEPVVAALAARVTPTTPIVKLSNTRSEWGSCTHNGHIRLSWRLVQLPPELARYVVAHEVAHLAEMNHSPRFWALVEALFPGHAVARRALDEWTALLEA